MKSLISDDLHEQTTNGFKRQGLWNEIITISKVIGNFSHQNIQPYKTYDLTAVYRLREDIIAMKTDRLVEMIVLNYDNVCSIIIPKNILPFVLFLYIRWSIIPFRY